MSGTEEIRKDRDDPLKDSTTELMLRLYHTDLGVFARNARIAEMTGAFYLYQGESKAAAQLNKYDAELYGFDSVLDKIENNKDHPEYADTGSLYDRIRGQQDQARSDLGQSPAVVDEIQDTIQTFADFDNAITSQKQPYDRAAGEIKSQEGTQDVGDFLDKYKDRITKAIRKLTKSLLDLAKAGDRDAELTLEDFYNTDIGSESTDDRLFSRSLKGDSLSEDILEDEYAGTDFGGAGYADHEEKQAMGVLAPDQPEMVFAEDDMER